jgi:tetratricopeptide (TPR) repeat protein
MKYKFLFLFILITFTAPVFAQTVTQPWWLTLEQGKLKYRNGDYGGALLSFEDARRQRRAMYEQMERDFINLLSLMEVRGIGDNLELVERFSRERYYTAASAALAELYYRVPKESLKNSASAALTAIGKLKDYPEAEYWIGEIYRVEGELTLALSQFRKAYEMSELSDDPGFGTDLLYRIAGILMTRQEYNEMESYLLAIINDEDLNPLWVNANKSESGMETNGNGRNPTPVPYAQASASFASQAMTRTLENDGIDRFLELYRYNNSVVERAHRQLGFFYAITGRPSAQQHLMFAFLIQNTVIIEEARRRQYGFTYTNLAALAEEINKSPILLSYIDTVEYYKTAYYLGSSLYRNGKTAVARSFWTFLASQPQAGEWYSRAIVQLRNPHLEPVVEMP